MSHEPAEITAEALSDALLLKRFASRRDEAAFAELVRRHGRLVWGVCRRRLARREDAEDAFQAAFLILAVKAHAIRSADALPGWLHRTACRAAIRVASASPVEATHDIPTESLDAFAEVTRREAATAIDEELVRLPERYRNAVVLFHLEGLERRDVAERLGMSEPTVKALLTRGRALLRTRLARRGLALPMVLPLVVDPVPAAAMEATCKLALSLTRAGLTPLDLVTLPAKGVRSMTALLSHKAVAATLVGAACLTLFFATRGDADVNTEGDGRQTVINTAFNAMPEDTPATVVLAANLQADDVAAEPAPAETAAAGEPQAPLTAPQKILLPESEKKIREALDDETEMAFPNTPLRDALQFLSDRHEINIIVDEKALEVEGLTVDDNIDIVLGGITLRSALNIMLSRYDLAYILEDEVMKITTQTVADTKVSTTAYDVSSLIAKGGSAAEVARVVEQLLQPEVFPPPTNEDGNSPPRPRIIPFQNRLIIKATAADLQEIEDILDLMWQGNGRPNAIGANLNRNAANPAINEANVKIFSLKNAEAAAAAKVLEDSIGAGSTLKLAVDHRTNSIVATGTENDLNIAEALLLRLDETKTEEVPATEPSADSSAAEK